MHHYCSSKVNMTDDHFLRPGTIKDAFEGWNHCLFLHQYMHCELLQILLGVNPWHCLLLDYSYPFLCLLNWRFSNFQHVEAEKLYFLFSITNPTSWCRHFDTWSTLVVFESWLKKLYEKTVEDSQGLNLVPISLCAHYQFYDSGMAANGFGTWRYSVTYRNLIVWLNGIRRGGLNMSKRILGRAGSIRKPIHVITPELSFSRPPIVWMLSGVRILFWQWITGNDTLCTWSLIW